MAYNKLDFSRKAIMALSGAPHGKRLYYSDTKEAGLLLCVTPNGTKSFQVYIKVNGRPVRTTLGRFSSSLADSIELPRDCSHNDFLANTPELNVRMARALAALVKIDLKSGVHSVDIKRAKRGEISLGQLFDEYVNRHLIPNGKKTIKASSETFERYLGDLPDTPRKKCGKQREKGPGGVNWQRRQLSTISNSEVRKLISDVGVGGGKAAANNLLVLLRAMFNRAAEWGLHSGGNPALGIPKFKVRSRERFLQTDELPRFFAAIAQEPSADVRDAILLGLLTGARKTNVLSMRWQDANLERAEWRIPDTKNGDPVTVPLMPEAVDILRARKPKNPEVFVFPGEGKAGHLHDTKKGWKRILDRDELNQLAQRIGESGGEFVWPIQKNKGPRDHGRILETQQESLERARRVALEMNIDTTGARLSDLRIHDLRRTLGSWQAATGASLVVIGKSLGHKNVASTAIYSRLNLDPVRESMQTATRAIFAAGGLLPPADVTPIHQARGKHKQGKENP